MGQQVFDSNGTFTVPAGINKISYSLIGGGGGGAAQATEGSLAYTGGGAAGATVCGSLDVLPEEEYSVVIGLGGAGGIAGGSVILAGGHPGAHSSFHTLVAMGGVGGSTIGYAGNGQWVTNCYNSSVDGLASWDGFGLGGQAGWQPGGIGASLGATCGAGYAGNATLGAGGGAVFGSNRSCQALYAGAGGNGRVLITWNDLIEDGGLLLNGTVIPEATTAGSLHMACKNLSDDDFEGSVDVLVISGTEVWRAV